MYKINFTTNTVTITNAFEKAAQVFGSEAYNMLIQFKKEGFAIVKPASMKHKKRPSYKDMRHYLSRCEDSEDLLQEFDRLIDLYKDVKGGYSKVYSWFHAECPYYGKAPECNADGKVLRFAEKVKKTELQKAS